MDKDISLNTSLTREDLAEEIERLRARLEEAEETLRAIRHGEVDALLVSGPGGAQVFTLESAEQPYRILIEQMQEGAVTLTQEGTVLYCNLRFAQMLKRPHEKILASDVRRLILPMQTEQFAALLQLGVAQSARAEITFCVGDGTRMPTYVTVSPLPAAVEGSICMIVTDLTEQESMRRNQAEIQTLNARLRRAMTETHHRVKNSLQIMSAFVDMQVLEHDELVPVETLHQLNLQMQTLATVHDVLTEQSKNQASGDTISSQFLLQRLLSMLQQIAAPRQLTYAVEDTRLRGRQPTSLALVVNELVLNALKHGKGAVEVTFRVREAAAYLEVCDDGDGLSGTDGSNREGAEMEGSRMDSSSMDSSNVTAGTGMALLDNLVTWDLQGTIVYQNRPDRKGACAIVTFPLVAFQNEERLVEWQPVEENR